MTASFLTSNIGIERQDFRSLMDDLRSEQMTVQLEIDRRLERGDDLSAVREIENRFEKENHRNLVHF